MGKKLVIVESPAKAKTINKILGGDYLVKASMGHVRDLPERRLGVDVDHGFRPDYVPLKGREKVLGELRSAAKGAEGVYLAPDPDREGEAIAWHLHEALKGAVPQGRFYRVTYNEITASAIRNAFDHVGRIDEKKVDSQQARRVLDRLVGYKVSPLLWRQVQGGSSAGRVQSVALRLVCEREQAIRDFNPEEYWILGALAAKLVDPRDPFALRLARINGEKAEIRNGEQAEQVRTDLDDRPLRVTGIQRRELTRRPMPPFITSTLQQAGSRLCGLSPSRTMRIAQSLYEGIESGSGPVGLITYMRTDSVAVARSAQEQCRQFIGETHGPAYVPERPNVYRSRGSAQEAHEAIRPTEVTRTPDAVAGRLKPEELRLYRIIWERFVASQMAPAVIAQRTVEVEAVPPSEDAARYLFRASASEVVFPGYMKVLGGKPRPAPKKKGEAAEGKSGDEGEEVEQLPPLEEGEMLERREWTAEQKFTQPPPRFSEATLVRALEENGIGRPSTYAQILATLQQRKYVEREKRALKPTGLGERVNGFLVKHLDPLFNVKFTADMEASLDRIEEGTVQWTAMLEEFYARLRGWIRESKGPEGDPKQVGRILELLEGVREWKPAVKRGKRTYSDEAFVESLRKQAAEKPLTGRQTEALKRLAWNYREQVPAIEAEADALEIAPPEGGEKTAAAEPRPETVRKLDLLANVAFEPPRQVGKRTFDDAAFCRSLREQVEQGRALSVNQIKYLDRLLQRYSGQVENYAEVAEELGVGKTAGEDAPSAEALAECESLLGQLKAVKEWKPPVQRGRRTWDDKAFYESLARQFRQRHSLSPRQLAALRKMAKRYTAKGEKDAKPGKGETAGGESVPPQPVAPREPPGESAPRSDAR